MPVLSASGILEASKGGEASGYGILSSQVFMTLNMVSESALLSQIEAGPIRQHFGPKQN
jgi:hypothetical protein